MTGCERLFRRDGYQNGEENLIRLAVEGLTDQGFTARAAVTDTIGGAWALAHVGPNRQHVVPSGQIVAELMSLPPWSLRLSPDVVAHLDALGIDRIETLIHLPRSSLAVRFGDEVLRRIDQATGDEVELLQPLKPKTVPAAGIGFPAPTVRQEVLHVASDKLTDSLCRQLTRLCAGVRSLSCAVYREDHPPEAFEVRFSTPTRNARHIVSLLKTRLERVDLSMGITGIRLWSPETVRMADIQGQLFEDGSTHDERSDALVAGLIDRLSNRLGLQAVVRPHWVDDHLPEHAFRSVPVIESIKREPESRYDGDTGLRPLRLFSRPQPVQVMVVVPDGPVAWFRWSGREHPVIHTLGPERITTAWWRGQDVQRDYFVVLAKNGCRFWLFRDRGSGQWFVHGSFD